MIQNETCENCGRTIGRLEQAMLKDGHVVCVACHSLLSAATVSKSGTEFVDKGEKLPPKPKPPFFTINRIDYVGIQRLKLVILDPDTGEVLSQNTDVEADVHLPTFVSEVERISGKRVTKCIVLERQWIEIDAKSTLEKVLSSFG